jgi:hypothetical protein
VSPQAFTFRNHRVGRGGWAASLVALVVIILLVPILLVLALVALAIALITILGGVLTRIVSGFMPGSAGPSSTDGRRNVRVVRREPGRDAPTSAGDD